MRIDRRLMGLAIAAADLIFVVVLILVIRHYRGIRGTEETALRKQQQEVMELQDRKKELEQELREIAAEIGTVSETPAVVVPAFFDLDEGIMTEMVYYSRSRGFKGTVFLRLGDLPGNVGKLSMNQFLGFLGEGWEYGAAWDGTTDLSRYMRTLRDRLEERDLAWPEVMYFPEGTYSSSYDSILLDAGIHTVIHHGEEGLDVPTPELSGDGLEKIASVDWQSPEFGTKIAEAEASGGLLVLDYFSRQADESARISGIQTSLQGVYEGETLSERTNKGPLTEAMEKRREKRDANLETLRLTAQKEDLEEQLTETTRRLEELTSVYTPE